MSWSFFFYLCCYSLSCNSARILVLSTDERNRNAIELTRFVNNQQRERERDFDVCVCVWKICVCIWNHCDGFKLYAILLHFIDTLRSKIYVASFGLLSRSLAALVQSVFSSKAKTITWSNHWEYKSNAARKHWNRSTRFKRLLWASLRNPNRSCALCVWVTHSTQKSWSDVWEICCERMRKSVKLRKCRAVYQNKSINMMKQENEREGHTDITHAHNARNKESNNNKSHCETHETQHLLRASKHTHTHMIERKNHEKKC